MAIPKHLAENILTSRAALEGERKHITVLFADLKGSFELIAEQDPEEAREVLDAVLQRMMEAVHHFEGTVNEARGDGIMALFGAPLAHEDHALRACHAALRMQAAVRRYATERERQGLPSVAIRVGLNSGEVVVRSIGSDLRVEYSAVGRTTHLAARMEQVARPGAIALSAATQRLVQGQVYTEALGPVAVKGLAEPTPVYELTGIRRAQSRLDDARPSALTPYVGRDRELRALLECFEMVRTGHGQVVSIVGEPGIGKSRLLYELRRQIGDEAAWQEARCVSFGQSTPFHPLTALLRKSFAIEDGDDETAVIDKITGGILAVDAGLRRIVPYVRYLLAVEPGEPGVAAMDAQARRGELFHGLRDLLLRQAQRTPLVVVYEDLQWTDKATEEYLALIAHSVPRARVLLIITCRTDYTPPFGARTEQVRIVPGTLSVEASVAMARAMLAAERLPEDLQALIASKSDGNPFFVEEIVKSLRESGSIRPTADGYVLTTRIEDVVVPDTVQDILAARIDRLPEALKRTLQVASVIGRQCSPRLLDRIADDGERTEPLLRELAAVGLMREGDVSPEPEYVFTHALTQDVAYRSLLVLHRKELHRATAVALETLHADRLSEHYEILAHHFARGETWQRALDYYMKAAAKAVAAFATRDALALYDAADGMADRLGDAVSDDTRMTVYRGRGELHILVSDFDRARSEWQRVAMLADRTGDREARGAALVAMSQASWLGHRFDQALDDSRQAAEIGDAIGAPSILAGSLLNSAIVYELTGRLEEARATFDHAIRTSRAIGDVTSEATALVFAAELVSWEGNYAGAGKLYERGIALGRAHGILVPVLEGLFMSGINFTGQGAHDRALSAFTEGLALAERVGDENYTPRYLNSLGWLHMECGSLDAARELNRRAAEGGRKRGDHESFANAELNLADIALIEGEVSLGRDYLEDVRRLVEDPATSEWMRWRYSIHLFASLGELALARGDLRPARAFADQCLERATRTRSRKYVVKGWRLRGEIALARRAWDDAESALREALMVAEEIGNPTQLWRTHAALGRLATERHRPDLAHAASRAARDVIDRVLESLREPSLRARFASWSARQVVAPM